MCTAPSNRSAHWSAFTLVEVVVGIACVLVLLLVLGLVVPLLTPRHHPPRESNNRSNVIGLAKAAIIYAGSNKDYFPGCAPTGRCLDNSPIAPATGLWGAAAIGDAPSAATFGDFVIATMLNDGGVAPKTLINPSEINANIVETPAAGNSMIQSTATSGNYSYAMLAGVTDTKASDGQPMQRHAGAGIAAEWKDNSRSNTLLFGDRINTHQGGTGMLSKQGISSVVTASGSGQWKGALCYGDAHCETQSTTEVSALRYGPNLPPGSSVGDSPAHADGGIFRSADCSDPASFTGQPRPNANGQPVFDSGFLWCPMRQ